MASDATVDTISELSELEERSRQSIGPSDRLAHRVSFFSGSMLFVWLHVLWFAAWITANLLLRRSSAFDPPPFGILTLIVSLEAIFLSTFVLITQNHQSAEADRRAKIDLQLNMIAEREVTKIIEMLADIQKRLGMDARDSEAREMQKLTRLDELAEATGVAEQAHDNN